MEIRQYDLPPAIDIADTDTLTGTKGGNPNDDKKYSWALIKSKLSQLFQTAPNSVVAGCFLEVDEDNVTISMGTVKINGSIIVTSEFEDTFLNSSPGKQRYVYFYGQLDGTIIAVQAPEGTIASPPSQPNNTAYISHIIISDNGIGTPPADTTAFALKSDLGEKTSLTTTNRNNVVEAVNEVNAVATSLQSDQETLKIFKVSNYGSI